MTGDAANELISFVADPNVSIQESKCLTGNIEPGRRSRMRRAVTSGDFPGEIELESEHERDLFPRGPRPEGDHNVGSAKQHEGK